MQQHYPTVAHKLSCSSFPSEYYLSLLVSNSNSNSNSDAAAKRRSAVEAKGPSRQSTGSLLFKKLMHSFVYQTAGAPLERVRLLIQCQGEMLKSGRLTEPYKGVHDCFKRIIKNEGFLSLWRGHFTALITGFSSQTLEIIFYSCFSRLFNYEKKDDDGKLKWVAGNIACHAAAEASSTFLIYPLHYARTRLANDVIIVKDTTKNRGSQRQFKGLVDVYWKTILCDGKTGLYRGFKVKCFSIMMSNGFIGFIGLMENSRVARRPKNSVEAMVVAVVISDTILAANYPLDTIQRRMMMTSGEAYKYKSGIDAFYQILKNEGFKSFYEGFGVSYLRRIVASFSLLTYLWLQDSVIGKSGEVSVSVKTKSAGDSKPF